MSISMSREEKNGITPELLREYFEYRDDGKLIWIKQPGGIKVGRVAGTIRSSNNYSQIKFFGRLYQAHRLIWIYNNKNNIPAGMEIDHRDRNRTNNRIENLRVVSSRENRMNRSDNKSGYPGVSWHKHHNKWRAQINNGEKYITTGHYNTLEEAVQARREAELKYGIEVREEFHKAS